VPTHEVSAIIVGAAVSAVVGWLSIRLLMRLVQTRTYMPFVAYRVAVGIFVLGYFGFWQHVKCLQAYGAGQDHLHSGLLSGVPHGARPQD
jgi:hypothetical protein